ncbi:MAG: hypothetical protein JHC81_04765 [Brevundimonas sp.]|uniref:hypothetical protein n=1 Tax=Brevundimonas sp. TaxID=1871086 RepID=UPI001A26D4C1|nr:hypothetical protein [Brevundimonas sp.]MBJ7446826.1 hypothetical protein [Brevundimonas sp.]
MKTQPTTSHERRSWHYPDPWAGVVWMPHPRPMLDALARVRTFVAFTFRALSIAMIAGTVLTVLATVAASAGTH